MFTIQDIRKEYDRLDNLCKVNTKGIKIIFSSRMQRRYGCCAFKNKKPVEIRIAENLRNSPDMFWDTVRHEYAHALVKLRYPNERHVHDDVWKRACIEVGCDPKRTAESSEDVKEKQEAQAKYIVTCSKCGKTFLYYRTAKVIKSLRAGYKHFSCPICHSTDLKLTEK